MIAADSSVDVMEDRLRAWGAYRASGGSAEGYPTRSVLHPSWTPPATGMRPAMRVASHSQARERALDERIGELCVRLQDTLYVVYVKRLAPADQAALLQCQPSTVRARVIEAKRLLRQ